MLSKYLKGRSENLKFGIALDNSEADSLGEK